MALHIANFFEAQRFSCIAASDMDMGQIIKISDDGTGNRLATLLGNSDSALLVSGKYGVSYKVSTDPFQVNSSTAPTFLGDRVVTILSGDPMVEVRKGAIVEYTADLLDASLDPARSGTTPTAGTALAVLNARWAASTAVGAITSPVIGRVYDVNGTTILVELVY